MTNVNHSLTQKILSFSKIENDYQYTLYALFTLLGFIVFYFINPQILQSGQYENFILRLIASLLSLILLLRKFWPNCVRRFLVGYWYCTLTFNLPFFFTLMLFQNNCNLEWQLNELMALTILALLTELNVLLISSIVGVSLGIISSWLLNSDTIQFFNLGGLISSYITILIFCSIQSYQKNKFYVKKLKFYEEIDKVNHSLEKKVKERTVELSEALKFKEDMLNNISHEIRTPIQGVSVISEELIEKWSILDEEKRYYYTNLVAKNAKRLFTLVANILDITKYSNNQMVLDIRESSLKEIIEEVIDESKTLYASNNNISFDFHPIEDFIAEIDKEKITQVVRNLIFNAIKYGHEENQISVKITEEMIKIKNGLDVEALKISITDQGLGIPENEVESIFLKFNQSTRTKTRAGGTGLGLAICKKIIEAHKGKIWAENNKSIGSTFSFVIPKNCNEHAHDNQELKKAKEFYTVLVIDDEEAALFALELMLSGNKYRVITANSGTDGLKKAKENHNIIDLVLLDLMMPDIYGVNLLNELKKDGSTSHIPIIIQSGVADETEKSKCIELGAASFLGKPYSKRDLIEKIEQILS